VKIQDEFQKLLLDHLYEGVYFVDRSRTITAWNKAAEAITGFSAEEVVGSHCMDNILNHVDESGDQLCFGQCPLSCTMDDGKEREETIYLHHKDGHRVAVDVRVVPLTNEEGEVIGAVEIFMESAAEASELRQVNPLVRRSAIDPEMILFNQANCETALCARFDDAMKSGKGFGMLLIDIDQLGGINENLGEETGNQVLQMTAATILNSIRPFDFLCRSETSDFVALVLNTTQSQLKRIAERVRVLVQHSSLFREKDPLKVTVSIGATMAEARDSLNTLRGRAEMNLKKSKQTGRNRVTAGAAESQKQASKYQA
jgi:diguanylate cyclase (GGDEF)-like protein/PAS domain S-box-containing protein